MNLSVFKNRNFILVALGRFVSEFGTYLFSFALSLYVLEKTESAALFATVIAVSIIPRIILTPFAGVIIDRVSRKKMVVSMDVISGIVLLAIGGVYFAQGELSLVFIYVVVIATNTINVFFSPAMSSMMPDIVEKERLADANSITELGGAAIAITAPIIAGLLYSGFGLLIIIVVDGISFLLSAFSESFIKIKKESLIPDEEHEGFFHSFAEGFRYIISMPEFIIIAGVAIIANFALAPIFSIALPIVILQDFGMSEAAYGVVTSLMTIGMFIGPIFAAGIIKKYHYSKLVSFILTLSGVICLLFGLACINGIFPNVYFNTVLMLVLINILMIIIIWVNLATATARQRIVPGHLQGRVVSVVGTVAMMATPAGQALMGYLLDSNDTYIIVGMFALLVILSGILAKFGFARLEKSGKMDVTPWGEQDKNTAGAETEPV